VIAVRTADHDTLVTRSPTPPPRRTVVPARYRIYAVALQHSGANCLYLLQMDHEIIEQWIRLARNEGMLLFLDLQMGRSKVLAKLPHIVRVSNLGRWCGAAGALSGR
jgi:hypothetical protein